MQQPDGTPARQTQQPARQRATLPQHLLMMISMCVHLEKTREGQAEVKTHGHVVCGQAVKLTFYCCSLICAISSNYRKLRNIYVNKSETKSEVPNVITCVLRRQRGIGRQKTPLSLALLSFGPRHCGWSG